MGNLWHVGDPHFGHMKVAKYRGFFTADGEVDNETRPNHLCVSWDVFRAPVSDNFLKRGILRQLGKKSLSTPVHWGFQEAFREHAEMLQKSGK